MEFIRKVRVIVELDTNKHTQKVELTPNEDEDHAEFAARVWDTLAEILELHNR